MRPERIDIPGAARGLARRKPTSGAEPPHGPAPKAELTLTGTVLAVPGSSGLDTEGGDLDMMSEALTPTWPDVVLDVASGEFTVFAPTGAASAELAKSLGIAIDALDEAGIAGALRGMLPDSAFIEAFSGRLRAECLTAHWSLSPADAREKMEAWRRQHNEDRPRDTIGCKVPIALMNRGGDTGQPSR